MITADTCFKCFIQRKKSISKKSAVLPIDKFPSLVLPRDAIMLQHLINPIYALLSVKWSLMGG